MRPFEQTMRKTLSNRPGTALACAAALLLLLSATATTVSAYADPRSSSGSGRKTTDFIDCNDPCNGGDVNYELVASVQTIKLAFGNHTFRGRTFARPDPTTNRVREGGNNHMGPTLTVKPGQSMHIKFRNELFPEETEGLLPKNVTLYDYWSRLITPGEKIKYEYYKKPVDAPELMEVDWSNIPGNFDWTNLHLHGLDVQVHMFDPVGTHDPRAPHVAIGPGSCYCYRFDVPEDHPDGLYWYHPHLHGSSAVQLWGGMMGLVKVEGKLMEDLERYNVRDSRDFVIWDPALQSVKDAKPDADHDVEVDEFLAGQTTLSKIHPFLVNGEITPVFGGVGVGEVLHLRVLCGTIENENTFIVYKKAPPGEEVDYATYDWKEHAVPFYVVASDGVTHGGQPRRREVLVLAGGQREELLLVFDEPGEYVVSQQGIQGMQFFDMYGHPHDQLLAEIHVEERPGGDRLPTVPVGEMVFAPGYRPEETIESHQISRTETIVFSMGTNRDTAPFPQYYINGKAFSPDRLDFRADPGEAVEYILVNANHNYHPFHIHVNRFQVKQMGSELSSKKYPILDEMTDFDQDVWRDTVAVPPNGRTRIWVQYKNYTGKTVLHCHFLAHEDTGMMATLFIGPPEEFGAEGSIPGLLLGSGMGLLVGAAFLALAGLLWGGMGPSHRPYGHYLYSRAAMNELKASAASKTLD
ncbi:unnamed protein product [Pseudo-nitzschia multistriata]|uniref:Plastocyanin-like domain-containing protein n=1 Tax=Pseudo-nitzschia multistriata TaxID=183589 RepID=A0A448Z351_9STRA|nr:unnamed protein product [Pseudo-nitzschia multistriata]